MSAPRTGPIRRLADHPPREDSAVLGSRQMVGATIARHPDLVRRWCVPVACDVATRAPLYDVDEAALTLSKRRRITDQGWRRRA